jgi:hypothetical protein
MPLFPSTEWIETVARLTTDDAAYRKYGRVDVIAGLKVGDRIFRLTFDVFEIGDVREIGAAELPELDFYIEQTPEQWRAMLQSIRENGHAGRDYTLNTLDLKLEDGLHHNAVEDGYRADKFFRFNESLQRFFDLSAGLETTFAADATGAKA